MRPPTMCRTRRAIVLAIRPFLERATDTATTPFE
jgi:hypothetical protein